MKKKNHIKMRFSTLLLCCLAFVLYAAPCACGQYFGLYYDEVGEYDVTVDEINKARGEAGLEKNGVLYWLDVGAGTIVNLYASVEDCVYVYPGGILNIYSGSVGYIAISPDKPYAQVTVYGTCFEDKLGPVNYGQWTPDVGADTLMGQYEDGSKINLLIWSNISISLQQPQLPPPSGDPKEITIDIKPGSDDNNINLKSKGVVPVAVLTTNDFDASTIDPDTDTVLFAGAKPERWTMEDVDNDGKDDMLFHFKTEKLELDEKSTKATLTATLIGKTTRETTEGEVVIQGTDEVCIKPQKNKK